MENLELFLHRKRSGLEEVLAYALARSTVSLKVIRLVRRDIAACDAILALIDRQIAKLG